MVEEHGQCLQQLAAALDRPLAESAVEPLCGYLQLVKQWNRKLDLTAARDAVQRAEVMAADALVLADESLVPPGSRVIDVGSGAGAPMVPLLILRPDLQALLVEPLRKRVAFLRTVAGSLELTDRMSVQEGRLDEQSALDDSFDVALSRATFAPDRWLTIGLGLATQAVVMTAAEACPPAPSGAVMVGEHQYALPSTGAPRQLAVYRRD